MNKPTTTHRVHCFSIAGLSFCAANFCDWKPGYQLSLRDPDVPGLDKARTFRTAEDCEAYARRRLKIFARRVLRGEKKGKV